MSEQSSDPGVFPAPDSRVLDLYKLAVEMADRTSARRAGANVFFVSLHGSLAALLGIIAAFAPKIEGRTNPLALGIVAIVGVIYSITWWLLLRYYRRLNRAKFDVISSLENSLPVQIYTDEWKVLHPDDIPIRPSSKRERLKFFIKRRKHSEASLVEQLVPVALLLVYIVLGAKVLL